MTKRQETLDSNPAIASVRRQASRVVGSFFAAAVLLVGVCAGSAWAQEESYEYDAAGRLIEARVDEQAIQYTYDAAGNLLERKVVPVPEPGATLFLLGALGALRIARRRR